MHVTTPQAMGWESRARGPRIWTLAGAVVAGLAIIFGLDRSTGAAPVQHLYYLPIVLAGVFSGYVGGLSAATAAIVLYHVANPHLLAFRYGELDIVQVALFIGVAIMSATLARDRRRLRILAMTDDLTGLHNLRSFEARLSHLVMESERTRMPLALFVLDVDRLKLLNDIHGHLTGAAAVRTIGHMIRERMPMEATVCRYGGDEFVVAVPRCDRVDALRLADEVRTGVQTLSPILNGAVFASGTLSVSIGVASASPRGAMRDPRRAGATLFAEADRALYAAKAAGRDRVHIAGGPSHSLKVLPGPAHRASAATHTVV